MTISIDCPKCVIRGQKGTRWHATGQRNSNRFGMRRAELVCDVCGYAFSSGRPAALAAAEAISGPDTVIPSQPREVVIPAPMLPGTDIPQPRLRKIGLQAIGALVKDWKQRAYGGDE